MASDFQPLNPIPQKISFRRGWVHAWVYGVLAALLGGLFLLYVAGVQCLGIFIGWGVVLTMQDVGESIRSGGRPFRSWDF